MIETFANGNVRSWASILDDSAREQIELISKLPILAGPLAIMPDAHKGHGSTIGTVLVTENAVIPMAVGVDIGCGMAARKLGLPEARRSSLVVDALGVTGARDWVREMGETVHAGLGKWGIASEDANRWIEKNKVPSYLDYPTREVAVKTAANQLGTLGSGNHFVELAVDSDNGLWILLHSGSRGAGNKLATRHAKVAVGFHGDDVTDPDLAWLDLGTKEFDDYIWDLYWSQAYAMENRRQLLVGAHRALEQVLGHPIGVEDEVNCHHNYAVFEECNDIGRPLYVTRKGAISAHKGDRGLIPGAMGQASFVVTGLGNDEAYRSAPHGAGRAMSRNRARKEIPLEDFQAKMDGVAWQDRDANALLDEAPQSYKDVEQVMRDSADLVSIDYRLTAIANYKGVEDRRKKR